MTFEEPFGPSIKLKPFGYKPMTDDELLEYSQVNEPLNFERDKSGNLIIMSPTGSKTSIYNTILITELQNWNKIHKKGYVFESNAGFHLPNSAIRSPDASFIEKTKWDMLSEDDKEKFAHICPDFVVEIKSKSNTLNELQEKLNEYIENGTTLGWILDFVNEEIFIYRRGKEAEYLQGFNRIISGENCLPGFELDLTIFKA